MTSCSWMNFQNGVSMTPHVGWRGQTLAWFQFHWPKGFHLGSWIGAGRVERVEIWKGWVSKMSWQILWNEILYDSQLHNPKFMVIYRRFMKIPWFTLAFWCDIQFLRWFIAHFRRWRQNWPVWNWQSRWMKWATSARPWGRGITFYNMHRWLGMYNNV